MRNNAALCLGILILVLVVGGMLMINIDSPSEQAGMPTVTRAPEAPLGNFCGNSVCEASVGESSLTCSSDCGFFLTETPTPQINLPTVQPLPIPNK